MAQGGTSGQLERDDYATLVPRLVYDLVAAHGDGLIHEIVEGTLLSADISGFTRLTEELAERGREGAEIITRAVNSCFADLIACADSRGGDVLKFGGDAVLVIFTGPGHVARAAAVGQEMQFALKRNSFAQRYQLQMTVGVATGPFEAIIVGSRQRDLLLCGPTTTETLTLEDGAEKGEVVVSRMVRDRIGTEPRASGYVLLNASTAASEEPPPLSAEALAPFVPAALSHYWSDYADLGAEHRQAAIGFVMISGVDAHLDAHGGLQTARELDHFIDAVHAELDQTGAVLLHSDMAMDGAKLLVGAGVPSAIDDPADALVHAALRISRIDTPFTVRQGLNIGSVFAGFLGAPGRRTFTVMGDAVNTAARMTGPAGPGDVVAVQTVLDRARGQVHGDALEPMAVKGKTTFVSATRVSDLTPAERSTEDEVPLTGRDGEVDDLATALREGETVSITGPAGSGKTRLTEEVVDPNRAISSVAGRYMVATPYGSFWAGVRRLLGIDANAGAAAAGEQLQATLQSNFPDLAEFAPLFAPLAGAELELNAVVSAIEPEFRRDVLHQRFVDMLSRPEPTITAIVVEDAQWLDDASRELTAHLTLVAAERGWVVVRSQRDSIDSDDAEASTSTASVQIELGPLDDQNIATIVRAASPRQMLEHEIQRLVDRAHGNPLFALELARSVGDPGQEIPASVEEVVAARLDRLSAHERRAVRLASVVGARFEVTTLTALAETAGDPLGIDPSTIDEIFTSDGDGRLRFRQLLYRDVAYAALPFAHRKRLHRVAGELVEAAAIASDDVDSVAALLSQHFFDAGDRRRCWTYSLRAAERAMRQYSPRDAITLYRRALDFAPRGVDRAQRCATFEGFGRALVAAGSLEEAYEAFGRARRLADAPAVALRLQTDQADCRNRQGRFADALKIYTRAAGSDAVTGPLSALILAGRSSVLYHLSRNREGYDVAHQALLAAEATGDHLLIGRALRQIGVAGEAIGAEDYRQAIERARAIFHDHGHLSEEAEMLNNLGVVAQLDGDLDTAADAYSSSLALKQRVGDLGGAALVEMNLGEVQLDRGSTEGVRDLLASCLSTFERTGSTVGAAYTQGLLGRCALLEGDPVSARRLLQSSSGLFLELGAEGYAADMDLLLIGALIDLDAIDDARRLLAANRLRLERDVFDNPVSAAQRLERYAAQLHR